MSVLAVASGVSQRDPCSVGAGGVGPRSDYRLRFIGRCRRLTLALQFLHAGLDRGKIIGGAGSGHVFPHRFFVRRS
jgi:hypothetical protein